MRLALLLLVTALTSCRASPAEESDFASALSDSGFAELQVRGASAGGMGVDQYTSSHRFDELPDGGRIELQRDTADAAGVSQIRRHLQQISNAFSRGDFQVPGFVHDRADVPGTDVMQEKRARIRYEFRELPRGGVVLIQSADSQAVRAIHEFLAFQRGDHRVEDHSAH